MKLHLKPSRGNLGRMKVRVVILKYVAHCQDLFYITVKYDNNIS